MSEFWVNIPALRDAAVEFAAVGKDLEFEIAEMSEVRNGISSCLGGECARGIEDQLRQLSEEMEREKRTIETMASALVDIADAYESTEKTVIGSADKCQIETKTSKEEIDPLTAKKAYDSSYAAIVMGMGDVFGASVGSMNKNEPLGTWVNEKSQSKRITGIGLEKIALTAFQNAANGGNNSPMGKQFGFSNEEEEMLKTAYERFNIVADYLGWDKKKKIHFFFTTLAALIPEYSSEAFYFELLAGSPSSEDAIGFFNLLGLDGKAMQEMLKKQHKSAPEYKIRDFAHECATIAVMSSDTPGKKLAGLLDNVDAMAGYKGDIWSTQMEEDDIKSDISSLNLYNRMINCEGDDIWGVYLDYNEGVTNGTINESLEFLENYGDGDPKKGWENLIEEMCNGSILRDVMMIHKGLDIPFSEPYKIFSKSKEDLKNTLIEVLECVTKFLDHIYTECKEAIG